MNGSLSGAGKGSKAWNRPKQASAFQQEQCAHLGTGDRNWKEWGNWCQEFHFQLQMQQEGLPSIWRVTRAKEHQRN